MSSGLEEVIPAYVLSGTRSLGVVMGGRVNVYRSLALAFGFGVASTNTLPVGEAECSWYPLVLDGSSKLRYTMRVG
jgi:hypothetical protein